MWKSLRFCRNEKEPDTRTLAVQREVQLQREETAIETFQRKYKRKLNTNDMPSGWELFDVVNAMREVIVRLEHPEHPA